MLFLSFPSPLLGSTKLVASVGGGDGDGLVVSGLVWLVLTVLLPSSTTENVDRGSGGRRWWFESRPVDTGECWVEVVLTVQWEDERLDKRRTRSRYRRTIKLEIWSSHCPFTIDHFSQGVGLELRLCSPM